MTHTEIVSFIWGVADLIRDTFKRGKYQDVILPLTVLRRLDCVLVPTKAKVLETRNRTIRLDQFLDEEVPLPPLAEQREIVGAFRTDEKRLEALLAKVREAIDRLKELRTALISAAVTGKIDVRGVA
jgi:type I restriction-modification system DNA methylase subunit